MVDEHRVEEPTRLKGAYVRGDRTQVVLGSHKRSRLPVLGTCRLCLREVQLELSHVVPRFVFADMKREGGIIVQANHLRVTVRQQDGIKLYALCGDCEDHLSASESHVAQCLRAWSEVDPKDFQSGSVLELENVDVRHLLRFVYSLVFRMSLLGDESQPRVTLSNRQQSELRRLILDDGNPSRRTVVALNKLIPGDIEDINVSGLMCHTFVKPKVRPIFHFDLLAGGWEWTLLWRTSRRRARRMRDLNVVGRSDAITFGVLALMDSATFRALLASGWDDSEPG